MGLPSLTYDAEADILYVQLSDAEVAYTRSLDDFRLVDYSADGGIVGIEFVDASAGVDLADVPSRETVERLIDDSGYGFKVYV